MFLRGDRFTWRLSHGCPYGSEAKNWPHKPKVHGSTPSNVFYFFVTAIWLEKSIGILYRNTIVFSMFRAILKNISIWDFCPYRQDVSVDKVATSTVFSNAMSADRRRRFRDDNLARKTDSRSSVDRQCNATREAPLQTPTRINLSAVQSKRFILCSNLCSLRGKTIGKEFNTSGEILNALTKRWFWRPALQLPIDDKLRITVFKIFKNFGFWVIATVFL